MPARPRTAFRTPSRRRCAGVTLTAVLLTGSAVALADPGGARPVHVTPATASEYDVHEEPDLVERVDIGGGESVPVSVWLPHQRQGGPAPGRVPVVLTVTPYAGAGISSQERYGQTEVQQDLVPYGYAFALAHAYGTGDSDGCWQHFGPREVHATLSVVEHLSNASWSTGAVGMRGSSASGVAAVMAAAADDERRRLVKAIVPLAGLADAYDGTAVGDGVVSLLNGPGLQQTYVATSLLPGSAPGPARAAARPGCAGDNAVASADVTLTGDHDEYWNDRDVRSGAREVEAAVLWVHGLRDLTVQPSVTVGFWEQLPETTPHKLVLGQWGHGEAARGVSGRQDLTRMERAWFDRYLKGLPTRVESWPAVQLQESSGLWRAEPDWPTVDGDPGHLPLAAGGVTVLREAAPGPQPAPPGTALPTRPGLPTDVSFLLPAGDRSLHLTGMPVLDLWVEVDAPDAHLTALLDVVAPDGSPLPGQVVFGARSLRHLDPMPEDRFVQDEGRAVPVGTPVRVPLRLQPTDLVVPPGHALRVRVSGAGGNEPPSAPSGGAATVTILHDCEHKSLLRFWMPDKTPRFLSIDGEPLPAPHDHVRDVEGDGAARQPVCGQQPYDPLRAVRGS